ncbi:hypothetical protein E4U54_000662 [Claviceps lovelessii]|nr:hypothetical protein E4U54_000662 [Claviceps lovelessii]
MHSHLLTLATAVSGASAVFNGFNFGNTFTDGRIKAEADFEAEFKAMQGLEGTDGRFNSARLYTMIQGGTNNQPIAAIPAAIKTKTSLLLGLWASAGQANFDKEIAALKNTIDQYCGKMDGLVAGISVGSEDLYRITPTGMAHSPDPGAGPDVLIKYIKSVRDTIKGSCLEKAPIGHVDTSDAYANATNLPLIDALDWVGIDTYPYYENEKDNSIDNGNQLFQSAVDKVKKAAGSKELWITETGWPVSGPTEHKAVAGTKEAQLYWQKVGCPRFDNTNVWWYTLQDGAPQVPNPSFGVVGSTLSTKPLYDLSCKGHEKADTKPDTQPDTKPSDGASQPTGSQPATTAPLPTNPSGAAGPTGVVPTGTNSAPSTVPTNDGNQLNALAGVIAGLVMAVAAL